IVKTNITLFVSPTIITPRKRNVLTEKTRDIICFSNDVNKEEFFNQRDPVARTFFGKPDTSIFNRFLRESSNLTDAKVEDCKASIDILKTLKIPPAKRFKFESLKGVLAQQKNPFLGIKKREGKLVFNA